MPVPASRPCATILRRALVFLLIAFFCHEAVAAPIWTPPTGFLPGDARRAIPNNPSPPARLIPRRMPAPLPPSDEGTIRRVTTRENVVALTFDLCELETSTTGYDAGIIDFLRKERIPATLFLGGKWMRTHSGRTKELIADPLFELGSHAWTHGNFGIMPEALMREQILWTQGQYELLYEETDALARSAGRRLDAPPYLHLFRLPYGRCSDNALKLLAEMGMQVIQWSIAAEGLPAAVVAGNVRPGDILLFHANLVPKNTLSCLAAVVYELRRRGYSFLTVSALLASGVPERTRDGYFTRPGDNLRLDRAYIRFGTASLPAKGKKKD